MYDLDKSKDHKSGIDVKIPNGWPRRQETTRVPKTSRDHMCGLEAKRPYISGLDGLGGRGGQLAGLDDRLELLGDRLLYKILALRNQHVHLAGFGRHNLGLN